MEQTISQNLDAIVPVTEDIEKVLSDEELEELLVEYNAHNKAVNDYIRTAIRVGSQLQISIDCAKKGTLTALKKQVSKEFGVSVTTLNKFLKIYHKRDKIKQALTDNPNGFSKIGVLLEEVGVTPKRVINPNKSTPAYKKYQKMVAKTVAAMGVAEDDDESLEKVTEILSGIVESGFISNGDEITAIADMKPEEIVSAMNKNYWEFKDTKKMFDNMGDNMMYNIPEQQFLALVKVARSGNQAMKDWYDSKFKAYDRLNEK